jgi:hypothetical protein
MKKAKNKLISAILTAALALSLTACTADDEGSIFDDFRGNREQQRQGGRDNDGGFSAGQITRATADALMIKNMIAHEIADQMARGRSFDFPRYPKHGFADITITESGSHLREGNFACHNLNDALVSALFRTGADFNFDNGAVRIWISVSDNDHIMIGVAYMPESRHQSFDAMPTFVATLRNNWITDGTWYGMRSNGVTGCGVLVGLYPEGTLAPEGESAPDVTELPTDPPTLPTMRTEFRAVTHSAK